MKKILQFLGIIGTIISIIVGVATLYFYLKRDNPVLEVSVYSEQLIIQQHNIDNLKATYVYKDSLEVNNLWQVKYIIRNIGKNTIVGQGEKTTLTGNGIGYSFSEYANVLYCNITNNAINANIENNYITFQQWRNNESIEISALVECQEYPQFKINDRDIIDADVKYRLFSTNNNEDKKMIRFMPDEYASVLRYVWLIYQLTFILGFAFILLKLQNKSAFFRELRHFSIFGKSIQISYKLAILIYCIILMAPILWLF